MNWGDLASDVADSAPAIGGALLGPAGGAAGTILASVFGSKDDPESVQKAIRADPEAAVKLRQAEMDHALDMRKLVVQGGQLRIQERQQELKAQTEQQGNVNETMRSEMQSNKFFKSSWRGFIGWVLGFNFLTINLALAWSLVDDPSKFESVVGAIMTLVVAMASVLGVNISGNRRERETAMTGVRSKGALESLSRAFSNRGKK